MPLASAKTLSTRSGALARKRSTGYAAIAAGASHRAWQMPELKSAAATAMRLRHA